MIKLKLTSIAPSLTKEKLLDLFEELGDVASIKIFRTIDNSAVAMAHVEMKKEWEANEAIEELNGMMIDGVKLRVEHSHEIVRTTGTKAVAPIDEDEDDEDDDDLPAFDDDDSEDLEENDDDEPKEVSLDEFDEEI